MAQIVFQVGQQCKENIFAIQTLRDFQYLDEGKDQGINVREKSKQLVLLLRDEERLKNERTRALKAKERFAQTACAFGSDTTLSRTTWGSGEETPTKEPGPLECKRSIDDDKRCRSLVAAAGHSCSQTS
ncbi:unnamed protein product, partial [Nesidiocoris tenuis]